VPVINYDAVIVGAGPAGLSAAILLGRCRRQTLVCDSGEYRNASSEAIHAFIGRDGTHPDLLRERGRGELVSYPSVELRDIAVHTARRTQTGFDVELADGQEIHCRVLLLATGGVDELPPLPGLDRCYGRSVFHCPYCDGWEQRDRPIAVYGRGQEIAALPRSIAQLGAGTVQSGCRLIGVGDLRAGARGGQLLPHLLHCVRQLRTGGAADHE